MFNADSETVDNVRSLRDRIEQVIVRLFKIVILRIGRIVVPVREDQACIPETHSRIVQRGVVRAHAGKTQSFETVIEIVQRLPGKTRPEIGSVDRPYSAFRYGEINGQRSRRQFHFQIDFRQKLQQEATVFLAERDILLFPFFRSGRPGAD